MTHLKSKQTIFYGWFVLAASFFVLFVSTGTRSSLGFFVLPMTEEFEWSRGSMSMALGIGWFANGVAQPAIGRLYDMYGGRLVVSISLLVIGVCTILLSATQSLWFLIGVYGVISVAAGGASLVTLHAVLAKWFYFRRGLVMSISTSGISTGALVLAPFTAYMILWAGWRMTWVVLGFVVLIALPMSFILIRDNQTGIGDSGGADFSSPPTADPRDTDEHPRGILETDYWVQSYRSHPIWQLTGAYFVCGMTTAIISFHYVPFAIDRGFSVGNAGLAFGLMSGLNVVGVLGVGTVSDKMSQKYLLGIVYGVRGLAYAMLLFVPGFFGLWGFAIVAGLSWIASAPLTSSLTADIYGTRNLGTIGGMTTLAHQLGGAISIAMGGMLYDLFGSYDVPFAISGSLLIAASVASFSVAETKYSMRYQKPLVPGLPGK
jgi:MFS family permease